MSLLHGDALRIGRLKIDVNEIIATQVWGNESETFVGLFTSAHEFRFSEGDEGFNDALAFHLRIKASLVERPQPLAPILPAPPPAKPYRSDRDKFMSEAAAAWNPNR